MTKYRDLFICWAFFLALDTAAQSSVHNVRAAFDGEKMLISYDLDHTDPARKFKVTVFSSHDNFNQPLSLLTGDFGDEVSPGKDRKVIWYTKTALPADFELEIRIKIKALLIPPPEPVRLGLRPLAKTSWRRGRQMSLEWVGGTASDQVRIELLKDGVLHQRIAENIVNVHQYRWAVPVDIKVAAGYAIRITNPNKQDERTVSQSFAIKPRFPLALKLIPIAVGVGIYLLVDPPTQELEDLPGPINPD